MTSFFFRKRGKKVIYKIRQTEGIEFSGVIKGYRFKPSLRSSIYTNNQEIYLTE